MHHLSLSRLAAICGVVVLALAFGAASAQDRDKDKDNPKVGGTPGAMTSIDGKWTVLAFERNGKAVTDANKMTVMIKGNVCTFSGGDEKNPQKAMRFEVGPHNTLRVTDADAGGKGGTGGSGTGGTGAAQPGGTGTGGTQPGGTGATQPGGTGGRDQARMGYFIAAHDYLAVSLFDGVTGGLGRPGTGTGTDKPGTGDTGKSGTGDTGKSGTGGTQPGGTGTGAADRGGAMSPSIVLILRKADAGSGTGTGKDRDR